MSEEASSLTENGEQDVGGAAAEHPKAPSQQEQEEEKEEDKQEELEQDWDLRSPLLLSSNHDHNNGHGNGLLVNDEQNSRTEYFEMVHNHDASSKNGEPGHNKTTKSLFLTPYEIFLSSTSTFLAFSCASLVLGSFYFSWSDTMLRIHADTVTVTGDGNSGDSMNSNDNMKKGPSIEFELPIYKDATLQTTLSIFQSSHSTTTVILIILSTIIAPIIWIIINPFLIWATHRLSFLHHKAQQQQQEQELEEEDEVSTPSSTPLFTRMKNYWTNVIWTHQRIGTLLTMAEMLMKYSLAVVYVQSILLVATSRIQFVISNPSSFLGSKWSSIGNVIDGNNIEDYDENHFEHQFYARIMNDTRGGLISYLMGISFGTLAIMVLRIHWRRNQDMNIDQNSSLSFTDPHEYEPVQMDTITSLGQESVDDHHEEEANMDSMNKDLLSMLKEDSTCSGDGDKRNGLSSPQNELSPQEEDDRNGYIQQQSNINVEEEGGRKENNDKSNQSNKITFSTILLIETGILSTLLWIPMYSLPLLKFDYSGLTVPILDPIITKQNTSLTFWDIAKSITFDGGSGALSWIAIVMFWTNVFIIPFLTWVVCTLIWAMRYWAGRKTTTSTNMIATLQFLYTGSNITPFALSMLVTIASLGKVSDFLFNQYGICDVLDTLRTAGSDLSGTPDGKCLLINGKLLPGFCVLLLQGLSLDIFVAATLLLS